MRNKMGLGLSFANVTAFAALCLSLGGISYAAGILPPHSVGPQQLERAAVIHGKLADGSVRKSALSRNLRHRLNQAGAAGPEGPEGPAGGDGTPGAAGPGAAKISYSDQASSSPTPKTALDAFGLRLVASCVQSGGDVGLQLELTSTEDAVLEDNFTFDTGTDPGVPGATSTSTIRIPLEAGTPLALGGPAASGSDFARVVADVVYVSATRTMIVTSAAFVDADTGECSIHGAAIPAA